MEEKKRKVDPTPKTVNPVAPPQNAPKPQPKDPKKPESPRPQPPKNPERPRS